jgi:hypothetical protein
MRFIIEVKCDDNCLSFSVANMVDRSDERRIFGYFPDETVVPVSARFVVMVIREGAEWGKGVLSISRASRGCLGLGIHTVSSKIFLDNVMFNANGGSLGLVSNEVVRKGWSLVAGSKRVDCGVKRGAMSRSDLE